VESQGFTFSCLLSAGVWVNDLHHGSPFQWIHGLFDYDGMFVVLSDCIIVDEIREM
jgi:hypothetical protein